jgi:hypothetical protein
VFPNPADPYDCVWHEKLAVLDVPNGDLIAIDLEPSAQGSVVYLSHDGGEVTVFNSERILPTSFRDGLSSGVRAQRIGNGCRSSTTTRARCKPIPPAPELGGAVLA